MNQYFVEAYKQAFGHFPSPAGEDEQIAFFNAVVSLCKWVALDPMTYDSTESGLDVACDIAVAIDNLCVKGE
jgi:hypothetical protein